MFQDLDIRYDNAFHKGAVPAADDAALIWRENGVLARLRGDRMEFPHFAELPEALRALPWRYAFSIGQKAYYLLTETGDADFSWPEGRFIPSAEYRRLEDREAVFAAMDDLDHAVGDTAAAARAFGCVDGNHVEPVF